jgi:phosphoribosylamine---glycine ligase
MRVLEFNGRFGDPEAQPLLMRIKSDIVPVMEAVIDGRLDQCTLDIDERAAVCVVMASGGYPGAYKKGASITGLEKAARRMKDVAVSRRHRPQRRSDVTDGGRVLGVTAVGATVAEAIDRAYQAVPRSAGRGGTTARTSAEKPSAAAAKPRWSASSWAAIRICPSWKEAVAMLKKFGRALRDDGGSAHRTPERAGPFRLRRRARGLKVIIAGAGQAAHLAGVLAAHTTLPVIGVPIDSSSLQGLDALLSTVQMPPGIPVATVAIGKPAPRNAGILAVQILATADEELAAQLEAHKKEMAEQVERKAKQLENYQ